MFKITCRMGATGELVPPARTDRKGRTLYRILWPARGVLGDGEWTLATLWAYGCSISYCDMPLWPVTPTRVHLKRGSDSEIVGYCCGDRIFPRRAGAGLVFVLDTGELVRRGAIADALVTLHEILA